MVRRVRRETVYVGCGRLCPFVKGNTMGTIDQNRLNKAYLRLATEAKRITESPGVIGIKGAEYKPKRKEKKPPKTQPPMEQQRMF
jgi:hypothetical protein